MLRGGQRLPALSSSFTLVVGQLTIYFNNLASWREFLVVTYAVCIQAPWRLP